MPIFPNKELLTGYNVTILINPLMYVTHCSNIY